MTYKPTILNVSTLILLTEAAIYFYLHSKGNASMNGGIYSFIKIFLVIGIIAGLIDLILQQYIKIKWLLNVLGLIVLVGISLFLFTII